MDRIGKLTELFDEHFERTAVDYERFAKILSDLARRKRPWQKTFIYNLIRRSSGFYVSDPMWEALLAFEKERSKAMRNQIIMSAYKVRQFSIVLSPSRECAWEECPEDFIPDHPRRRYHSDRCRMDARNKRRREIRLDTLIRNKQHGICCPTAF